MAEPGTVTLRPGAVVVTFSLPEKTPEKTSDAILSLLAANPGLSVSEVAIQLTKSERAVERAVRKLRESGRLERVGPDKGGYWKVIE